MINNINNKESSIYDCGVVEGMTNILEAVLDKRKLEFNKKNVKALLVELEITDYVEELLSTYFSNDE